MRMFSVTVMSGKRLRSCGTKQMPRCRIWSGRSPASARALEDDAPAPRRQQAADRLQKRRLAGAVRADDAVAPVRLDREREAGQDVRADAVAGDDVLDLEQRHQPTPR